MAKNLSTQGLMRLQQKTVMQVSFTGTVAVVANLCNHGHFLIFRAPKVELNSKCQVFHSQVDKRVIFWCLHFVTLQVHLAP